MTKLEAEFQAQLVKQFEELLPECVVLVKPGYYIQGFPDLMILYKNRWAALECKQSESSRYQPNQQWWIGELNEMGYAAMICPENCKEIIDEVLQSFGIGK